MHLLHNSHLPSAGRTVTYTRAERPDEPVQAVIVEISAQQCAELDNGEYVLLPTLHVVASDEQWRPVSGFEERYLISSHGKVLSLRYRRTGRRRLMRATGPDRYPSVSLHDGAQEIQIGLNRLVARHFLPPPTELRFDHLMPKDGNHLNLRADNLQ